MLVIFDETVNFQAYNKHAVASGAQQQVGPWFESNTPYPCQEGHCSLPLTPVS